MNKKNREEVFKENSKELSRMLVQLLLKLESDTCSVAETLELMRDIRFVMEVVDDEDYMYRRGYRLIL